MGVAATPESHDLIDEVAPSFSGPPNLAEAMRGPAVGLDLRLGHFRIAEDRAHDIVEVVRDAAGKRAHRLHAAALLQPRLQSRSLLLHRLPLNGIENGVESHAQQT